VCRDCPELVFDFFVFLFGQCLWFADNAIPVEELHDVGVDDRIVFKSDVSEEVTCFFIPESGDVLYEPFSSSFSLKCVNHFLDGFFFVL